MIFRHCVTPLDKLCKNILKRDSIKFRRIRTDNERVAERLVGVEGALHVMIVIGFSIDAFEDDFGNESDFLHLPYHVPVENLEIALRVIDKYLWGPLNELLDANEI